MAHGCRLLALVFAPAISQGLATAGDPWYVGLDNVKVFGPGDDVATAVWNIYQTQQYNQFGTERFAVLLKSGDYGELQIPLGYYTSVAGVGTSRDEVLVKSFYSNDGIGGEATCNFWRSVEGVTATTSSVAWATSQACPLRRTVVQGDLQLSETGYSSGGFMGDVIVNGQLDTGTQQQFLVRNTRLSSVQPMGGWNFVFVGVQGAPTSMVGKPYGLSVEATTPAIAEKPYLVEKNEEWWIVVPPILNNRVGPVDNPASGLEWISMDDVYVAKPGDSAAKITQGMQTKKGLLLTPGIYNLEGAIVVSKPGFVVLGIGFPTLVTTGSFSALVVAASNARVASILVEGGFASTSVPTAALVQWSGNGGVLSDIFTRMGSFKYRGCPLTRADVHVQIDGSGVIVDNTWFWHADHDDCGRKSDSAYSGNGLVVHGADVTIYGLKVEHMMKDLVWWAGTGGSTFFYQSELPYHDLAFGSQGFSGYYVDYSVQSHRATGLGVYIIGDLHMPTAYRAPAWAKMSNMLIWCITGSVRQFANLICTSPGTTKCLQGNQCLNDKACYLSRLPPAPSPPPSPTPSPSPSPSPSPGPATCTVGSNVHCQNSKANCKGQECCPDGSICPSAPNSWKGCPKPKDYDCTQGAALPLFERKNMSSEPVEPIVFVL